MPSSHQLLAGKEGDTAVGQPAFGSETYIIFAYLMPLRNAGYKLVDRHTLNQILCICRNFTETALGLSTTILQSVIDLVSFSGILYTIYPPLFAALLVYSIGGTTISLYLGRNLVGLNFQQEAQEANFRY